MNKQRKNQKGITLIALVITIIVLLILAGVSLSLVVGQNGVLNKATDSVVATQKGTAVEQVSLAWSACQTDYLTSGSGSEKSTFFTKEKLNSNLSQGEVTEVNFEKNANDSEVKYKLDNTTYTVIVSSDGIVKIAGEGTGNDPVTPPSADEISLSDIKANPSEYYGKKVTGYTANEISDWRIFYADDENVFLITTDYLPSGKAVACNNTMTVKENYNYGVFWNPAPDVASLTTNAAKFSPITSETMAWTGNYGTNNNGKCVSTLLDTSKWTSLVDSNKATMAIGSPTLNMWVASWNSKYPSDKLYCNSSDEIGYNIGISNEPESGGIADSIMSAKEGYQVAEAENMYYPHKSGLDDNKCAGYMLASPAKGGENYVVSVRFSGSFYLGYYFDTRAIRPVVCLKSGIEMTKNDDGTIAIGM